MFGKRWVWSCVIAIALVTIIAPVAIMSAPTGSSPEDAMAPSGTWMPLDVGQHHWYAFYAPGRDKDKVAPMTQVELQVIPRNAAAFEVWNPQRLHEFAVKEKGAKVWPLGAGAAVDTKGNTGKLTWASALAEPGVYYVRVDQAGPAAASYLLTIKGDKISFQPVTPAQVAAVAPAAAGKPGSGPADALEADGQWQSIAVGEEQWFVFQAPGRDKDGKAPLTKVEMNAAPINGAHFSIWTPEGVRLWSTGAEKEQKATIGCSCAEEVKAGATMDKLHWSGRLVQPGKYYVRVDQNGPAAAGYQLRVTTE